MKNKLILAGVAGAAALASTASAALPTEVGTAITNGATDATAVATAGVAVMAVFITWKLIRRAVNRLV
jgi:hypothetical protein